MLTAMVYQCDTCKRVIQLAQNKQGVDVVGKCIITGNCKGKLFLTGKKENVLQIPIPTPPEPGIDNWEQRKLLYIHTQTTESTQWRVRHNLGTNPVVQTYIQTEGLPAEIVPLHITYDSPFQATITLALPYKGIAQCIARTSSLVTPVSNVPTPPITFSQVTVNSELTLATRVSDDVDIELHLHVFDPQSLLELASIPVTFTYPVVFLSPWNEVAEARFNNTNYTLRTANLAEIVADNNIPDYAPFYFDGELVTSDDCFMLLGVPPYTNQDKDLSHVLQLIAVRNSNYPTTTYQLNGSFFVDKSLQRSIYPPIKKNS